MKTNIIFISLVLLALFCSCGGGKHEKSAAAGAGGGVLAPLATKYIEIAENNLISEEVLKELDLKSGDSALKKADKICDEVRKKNEALVEEAKEIAEKLKGQSIECSTADGAGAATCTIFGVKVTTKSANVVLAFSGASAYGCLFQDGDGQNLGKMKTFVNGDGTLGVIYVLGTKNNAKTACLASRIEKIVLVSEADYNAAAVAE